MIAPNQRGETTMAMQEVDRFKVRSDKSGQEHIAIAYRSDSKLNRPTGYRGPLNVGPTDFELTDGRCLILVEGDTEAFKIVGTDEIVRKV